MPGIKYVGAQTSNNIVASLLRTQWYTKSSASVHLWSCPRSLQLFLLAADTHSVTLAGHRFTMETVEMDSGHILNANDCNMILKKTCTLFLEHRQVMRHIQAKCNTYNSSKTDWDDNIKHRHLFGGWQQAYK